MNIININNFEKDLPEIINTFIEVFGKHNEELIRRERQNNIIYSEYIEPETALEYYKFLRNAKLNEITIKYLQKIGVLDTHYELRKSYQIFPKKIKDLIAKYLSNVHGSSSFDSEISTNRGIKSFLKEEIVGENENMTDFIKRLRLEAQITYLNNLRNNIEPKITPENYENFKLTPEYSKLSKEIESYLTVYQELLAEVNEYKKEIKYLKDYYKKETERKKKIRQLKMLDLYKSILPSIPSEINKQIDEKFNSIPEKVKFLLGKDFKEESLIESFSSQNNELLEKDTTKEHEKNSILISRVLYFSVLGANVDFLDYKKYDELIKKDDIKALIPPAHFVDLLIEKKKSCEERAKKTFAYSSEHFKSNTQNIISELIKDKNLPESEYSSLKLQIKDILYERLLNGHNCISEINNDKDKELRPLLFLLIGKFEFGQIDYVFLHELCHAIEFEVEGNVWRSGFDYASENDENPYNSEYRRYERLNETMDDIIIEKVRKKLFKKGIYIADNRKLTDTKFVKNRNTDNILKKMLYPLFARVNQEILDARLSGGRFRIMNTIGNANFENLNDTINIVDFLIEKKNLKEKLKEKDYEAPVVKEYYNQLARLNSIYKDIDEILQGHYESTNNKELKKLL